MLASVPIREEIKKAMREQDLSHEKLAKMCNDLGDKMRPKDISNYLREKHDFGNSKLEVIAQALGKKWILTD